MGGKVGLGRPLIGLHAASAFLFAEPLSSLQRPSPQLFTGCVKFRALLLCDILMFGKKSNRIEIWVSSLGGSARKHSPLLASGDFEFQPVLFRDTPMELGLGFEEGTMVYITFPVHFALASSPRLHSSWRSLILGLESTTKTPTNFC
jgi:hypothetical protein